MPRTKHTFAKTMIQGSTITFVGMIFVGLINYFSRRTLAIELSTEEYGFFYAAWSFIMIIGFFFDLGLGYTANILIARYDVLDGHDDKLNKIYSIMFSLKVIMGIVAVIFLMGFSSLLTEHYFKFSNGRLAFIFISLSLFFFITSGFISVVLTALKDYAFNVLLLNLYALIVFIFIIIFTRFIKENAPSIGFIINGFIVTVIGMIYIAKKYKLIISFSINASIRKELQEIWHVGKWLAFGTAGLNMLYFIDSNMLTLMSDLQKVALYNIALPIVQIFQTILVFPTVFIPIASSLWAKHKKIEIGVITSKFISFTVMILWIVFLMTYTFGKNIISILFSDKYLAAHNALIVLSIGICIYSLAIFLLGIINCSGNEKSGAKIVFMGVFINIILNISLIPFFDIMGASISTMLSYSLIALLGVLKAMKLIRNIRLPWKIYAVYSIIGCFSFTLLYWVNTQINNIFLSILVITVFLFFSVIQFRDVILFVIKNLHPAKQ